MSVETRLLDTLEVVKRHRRRLGAQDMVPVLHVEFEGDVVATVFLPVPKDRIIALLPAIAVGMSASALTLAIDGRVHTTSAPHGEVLEDPLNPVTGKPWKPGEMTALAEDGMDLAKHGVMETVYVTRCERQDPERVLSVAAPYRVAAGSLDFLPTDWDDGEVAVSDGLFADALTFALRQPPLSEIVAGMDDMLARAAADELTVDEMRAHERAGVVKLLVNMGLPVLVGARNDVEVEVLMRSLGLTREQITDLTDNRDESDR